MDTPTPQPPPPPVPPSATPPPVRRGWWARNWLWFVPAGCFTLIVLFVAFVGIILVTVLGAIKSTDAYKIAVARAKADPRVGYAIGTPIKEGWFVGGKTEVTGGSGTSDLSIPISGPKGKAKIYANATKSAGEWHFNKLVVKTESPEETIDLAEEAGNADEDQESDSSGE